jgi:hypothetical protein
VITTDFFTPCWKSADLPRERPKKSTPRAAQRFLEVVRAFAALLIATSVLAGFGRAQAETPASITQLSVERSEEGVYATAVVEFELPPIVEEALQKGIPMFFLAEASVFRERWYWYDRRVAGAARHMRLAYQPLTRRWRINISPSQITNVGLGVILNFESLSEALAALQRVSRWKIADSGELDAEGRYTVDFRFRLDVSQLPRPFQIGAVGQSEWRLAAVRNARLPEPTR